MEVEDREGISVKKEENSKTPLHKVPVDQSWLHWKEPIPKIRNKYSQKRNCAATDPISTFTCLCSDLYIPRIDLPILLQEICGPILGINKSLTDTWMKKFGLRLRNSFSGNICFGFSVLVLCSVANSCPLALYGEGLRCFLPVKKCDKERIKQMERIKKR